MTKLKVLDLFSGIGGFSLGLERTGGFETVAFCEIEAFPRRVLSKHWPEVPIFDDVREIRGRKGAVLHRYYSNSAKGGVYDLWEHLPVDVICGGFPCQDISTSGSGNGIDGERSGLWREFARLIGEIRPQFVIVENSSNLAAGGDGRWMGRVLGDLAEVGFDAEWHCIPASAVGAPHRRDRIWIIAYPAGFGQSQQGQCLKSIDPAPDAYREAGGLICAFQEGSLPFVCGSHDGVSDAMGELTAYGNAVVPQIPEMIGRAILEARAAA